MPEVGDGLRRDGITSSGPAAAAGRAARRCGRRAGPDRRRRMAAERLDAEERLGRRPPRRPAPGRSAARSPRPAPAVMIVSSTRAQAVHVGDDADHGARPRAARRTRSISASSRTAAGAVERRRMAQARRSVARSVANVGGPAARRRPAGGPVRPSSVEYATLGDLRGRGWSGRPASAASAAVSGWCSPDQAQVARPGPRATAASASTPSTSRAADDIHPAIARTRPRRLRPGPDASTDAPVPRLGLDPGGPVGGDDGHRRRSSRRPSSRRTSSTGDAIGDDYTHDEALTVAAVGARASWSARRRPPRSPRSCALANEHGVPVTARGTRHRPVRRVHPASRTAIVVSFERMNAILEIDTENHVAVVQPGVTLDQLDEATAPHGLVYPVFPGEYSASLGGNVATNAGGMRAVKYGVTRHQVLGLEAVLADRRGHPHRRQVREGDDRLRPHAADHRLRGHARARHRGDAASSTRGPRTPATVLAPFADARRGDAPRSRGSSHSGVGPLILEYIDMMTMVGDHRVRRASTSASPQDDPGARRSRTSSSMLESTHERPARRGHRARSPSCSPSSARIDVYVLPARRGRAAHRRAREGVLGREGERRRRHRRHRRAAGVDPRVHGAGAASSPQRHRLVDRRLRARRRRQRAPLGVPARPRGPAPACCTSCSRPGMALGGAISGEHGIGTAKKRVLPRARGPGQDRRSCAASRPRSTRTAS